jgi:hypothetical protein
MAFDIQALPIGSTSTNSALESLLGQEIEVSNLIPTITGVTKLRLVKTADATSIADGRPVLWSSVTARTVTGAAAAASALRGTVAGLAVLTAPGATYSGGTLAVTGTYFWVATRGPAYSNGATGAGAVGGSLATQTGGALGTTAAAAFGTNIAVATSTSTSAGVVVLVDLNV